MEKLPPIEKVYEAWSAVADGRVALHPDERRAAIASSNGAKTYTVAWNENGSTYSSNDNATYWQGLDAVRVEAAARKAFDALGALDIVVKQGSARPPKSPKA